MKRSYFILSLVLFVIIGLEIYLRLAWGFCDAVLMQEDSKFEYIAQPNQNRFRFKNHILYNNLSMRSDEVDSAAIKIVGFGDSVINGGSLTDQDSLATNILSKKLSKICNRHVQFLNVSAGSWGPDNCFAYLNKYGNFSSKHFILFVSSHDAFDNMDFKKTVGLNDNFPNKQYQLALIELFNRYLLQRIYHLLGITPHTDEQLGINKRQQNSEFNTGFENFYRYCEKNKIELVIYLHAETSELSAQKFNEQGKKIEAFAEEKQIKLITDIDQGLSSVDYRDNIHLNEKGQSKMAELVLRYLQPRLCE
jgi:hypothetical protein